MTAAAGNRRSDVITKMVANIIRMITQISSICLGISAGVGVTRSFIMAYDVDTAVCLVLLHRSQDGGKLRLCNSGEAALPSDTH